MSEDRPQLPTWEEAKAADRETLPTWEEALAADRAQPPTRSFLDVLSFGGPSVQSGSGNDAYFTHSLPGKILSAFGHGAAQTWGAGNDFLGPETAEYFKKQGIAKDYEDGRGSLIKAFNEGAFRTAAQAYSFANLLYGGTAALFGGAHEAAVAAAQEGGVTGAIGGAVAGGMEAFPLGHVTGLPRVPVMRPPLPGLADFSRRPGEAPMAGYARPTGAMARTAAEEYGLRPLQEARDLNVIGPGGEAAWKGLPTPQQAAVEALRPPQPEARPPVGGLEGVPPAPPGAVELPELVVTPTDRTPEIHARARTIAPDTFREYDALDAQRETLRQHLDEMRGGSEVRNIEEQIDTLRAQRLAAPQAERRGLANQITELERQRAAVADQLAKGDTPQMTLVRRALQETDYRMRELSPDVSKAYRDAQVPTGEPAAPVAPEAQPAVPGAAEPPPAAPADPLALQRRGELTPARATEIRDNLPADHPDREMWRIVTRNLESAEASREGGLAVVADQIGYLPERGEPTTASQREAVAVIGRALQAEAARGGDVAGFLDEAARRKPLSDEQRQLLIAESARPPEATPVAAPAPPAVESPATAAARASIAEERSRQLVAAGYPKETADQAAQFEAAHYRTMATLYPELGTAEEIYAAEVPEVRAGRVARALEMAQQRTRELGQGEAPIPTGPLGVEPRERALTALDILAPETPRAPSSVVEKIAAGLQERAQRALRALGVRGGVITGPALRTDEIISRAMAAEVKAAAERAGHALDWYTSKVQEGLAIATEIHPELRTDINARSHFTAAMAITSQGEKVPSNVRLTDIAYDYFKRNGRFPTDLQVKDPAINKNFRKYNQYLDRLGPDGLREFLHTEFTVRELEGVTGKEISGENKGTRVYGSAIFGPKVGQGFFQNLNGNFTPVTMDLWFTRSWGRLTGRLVGKPDTAVAKQRARLEQAMTAEGRAVPKTLAALGRRAQVIMTQHERDYAQYRAEYNDGTRTKSELVYAAERYLWGRHGIIDAPTSGSQRDWMRARVERARELLAGEGLTVTNADLQALWWYPEKDIYAKMGGVPTEGLNVDYATAFRDLAKQKGLSDEDIGRAIRTVERRPGPAGAAAVGRGAEAGGGARFPTVAEGAQAERGILHQGAEPGETVTFEVAPDPRNLTVVARWNVLPQAIRERISHRIATQIVNRALDNIGAKGDLLVHDGAWLDDANPSLTLKLDPGTSPAQVGILSRLLGYALRQEETLRISPTSFPGGKATGVVLVELPRATTSAEIHAIYGQIRELTHENGEPYVLGHTTGENRVMHILNNNEKAPIETAALAKLIDEKLGGKYGIDTDTFYAERVQAGDNDYGLSRPPEAGGVREEVSGQPLRGAGDNLRAEAQQYIEAELARVEAGGEPGAAAARVPPAEVEQARRGSIRLADVAKNTRAVITLFKDADASTFIHELGHAWLEELVRFTVREGAPAGMIADLATVRRWVSEARPGERTVGEGGFTVRQHEQFARGFERYVMEGVAPSRELAGVFAKFKEWLIRIYQTVDRLRSPINDEIRGVYSRLLAAEPEAIIAPEREPVRGFAETHEADVAATPAELAPVVADHIRGERDAIAAANPALDAERLAAVGRAAETGGDAAGGGVSDRGGAAGQPQPGGPGAGTQPGALGPGGAAAPTQGPQRQPGGPQPRAGNEPFATAESNYVDKAGNIRLDNLNTPEDVNAVIREAAAQGNDFIGARRGVISDAEVLNLADDLGMSAKSLNKRRLGEAFNAEQIMAARRLLVDSAVGVRDAAAKVQGGTEADLMAYVAARTRHMMIQEQVAGLTAEAGRALRAFRAIEGSGEASQLGLVLREQTGLTLNQMRQEAVRLNQLATPQQVSKTMNRLRQPTWKDMGIEAWLMGVLSGTPTLVANFVGNASVAVESVLESAVAAGIGAGRRAALGALAGERITGGEVAARTFALLKGSQEGVIAAGKLIVDETAIAQTGLKMEQRQMRAIPGLLGRVVRLPGRALTATDELFSAIAFREELNGLAHRQATREGLTGTAHDARVADLIENTPDAMIEAAQKHARYQTFTNPLGQTGRSLQAAINSQHPLSVAAKIIVPFMRTPVNLFKYAAERTPFGLLSAEVRNNLMGRNGSIARDVQIARITLGTAVATSIVALAASTDMFPAITGAGPSDPAKKAALRQAGWQPYSMKIGNFYYSYAWMDPWATIIGTTADLVETVKAGRADDAEAAKVAGMAVLSISQNLMGKLSLRGIANLIQAVTDPDRYGERFLQGIAGSIVPSVLAVPARVEDPVLREMRTIGDAIVARVPGWRETLHPKIDVWGMPVVNQGALGPDELSRAFMSQISNDPATIELERLGVMPAKLDRKIRGVELPDAVYEDYARTAGTMTKMQLDRLVRQPTFANWPDFAKREAVKHLVDGTREGARGLMMMRYPFIWQAAAGAKRAQVGGATPEHVRSMLRNPAGAPVQ